METTSWPLNYPKSDEWPPRRPFPWENGNFDIEDVSKRGNYIIIWLKNWKVVGSKVINDTWIILVYKNGKAVIKLPDRSLRSRRFDGTLAQRNDFNDTRITLQDSAADWAIEALGPDWKIFPGTDLPAELVRQYRGEKEWNSTRNQLGRGLSAPGWGAYGEFTGVEGPNDTFWWFEQIGGYGEIEIKNEYIYEGDWGGGTQRRIHWFPWVGAYESLEKLIED
jgi:hypothetical protein